MDPKKRDRLIAGINARIPAPSGDDLRALKERNMETWGEYIVDQADDAGVSVSNAYNLFQMLGESEAFDGFVTELEDLSLVGEEE